MLSFFLTTNPDWVRRFSTLHSAHRPVGTHVCFLAALSATGGAACTGSVSAIDRTVSAGCEARSDFPHAVAEAMQYAAVSSAGAVRFIGTRLVLIRRDAPHSAESVPGCKTGESV